MKGQEIEMKNNNTERELRFRLIFYANVKDEKKFFVSPHSETREEYREVIMDTIKYNDEKIEKIKEELAKEIEEFRNKYIPIPPCPLSLDRTPNTNTNTNTINISDDEIPF